MIILDTNVVSEMMQQAPDPAVEAWLGRRTVAELATTAVTVFELRYGAGLMPPSSERKRLSDMIDRLLAGILGTVLSIDAEAAAEAAEFRLMRRRLGREVGFADALIAGIARSGRHALATRNIRDFEHADIDLINPWLKPGDLP